METLEITKEDKKAPSQKSRLRNYQVLLQYWKYFLQKKWKPFSVIRAALSCQSMMHCMITRKN